MDILIRAIGETRWTVIKRWLRALHKIQEHLNTNMNGKWWWIYRLLLQLSLMTYHDLMLKMCAKTVFCLFHYLANSIHINNKIIYLKCYFGLISSLLSKMIRFFQGDGTSSWPSIPLWLQRVWKTLWNLYLIISLGSKGSGETSSFEIFSMTFPVRVCIHI